MALMNYTDNRLVSQERPVEELRELIQNWLQAHLPAENEDEQHLNQHQNNSL